MESSSNQIEVPVFGLRDTQDATLLDKVLGDIKGVVRHSVNFNNQKALVEMEPDTSIETLIQAIHDRGYGVPVSKINFIVTGMSCASCALSSETMLQAQKGVIKASVNYANSEASVTYLPGNTSLPEMKQALQSIGYDLVAEEEGEDAVTRMRTNLLKSQQAKMIWALGLSLPLVVLGMFFMDLPGVNYVMLVLSAPVLFWFGRGFFMNAWKQARHGKANMDTLVALSSGIAFVFSAFNTFYPEFWIRRGLEPHVYFEASAVVVAFILLGKVLEERAKASTSSAIKKLIGLQPKTVILIQADGQEIQTPIVAVKMGDLIRIRPGDKVPVDGEVLEGSSFVDESMISGESIPLEKKSGDKVFAGTLNQKGSFKIKALKVGGDTLLAQIIRMVQEAQGSKAPVQKLVDQVAGIFVPLVMGISILSFFLWIILGGSNGITHGLLAMITVLVVACPCALGLATPTAIMVGVGKAAESGILIRDAESLELARKVDAIVLDKTGTITLGKPRMTDFVSPLQGSELLAIKENLLSMESQSEHPLAEAISAQLRKEGIKILPIEGIESVTGKGAKALWNGRRYAAGTKRLIEEMGVRIPEEMVKKGEELEAQAKTVMFFADEKNVLALMAVADEVKETSAEAIRILQEQGIAIYMLTGDNFRTAQAVAERVGVRHFKAGVLPAEKANFVKDLQKEGKTVAMVGDGINDSQALAEADVSIAMGRGSDIAMDVAKMTIISSDLLLVPKAIRLSKLTVKAIRQNLFWAFIYNLVGIPIAAGVLYSVNGFLLNPMFAGAAMAMSSVSVVGNSLLLKWKRV